MCCVFFYSKGLIHLGTSMCSAKSMANWPLYHEIFYLTHCPEHGMREKLMSCSRWKDIVLTEAWMYILTLPIINSVRGIAY